MAESYKRGVQCIEYGREANSEYRGVWVLCGLSRADENSRRGKFLRGAREYARVSSCLRFVNVKCARCVKVRSGFMVV